MKINRTFAAFLIALAAGFPIQAAIIITEVHPGGSGNATYAADFFELTNTGNSAVNITGWKMDDNSNGSPASTQVALRGVTSINAGQSVIFAEGDATGTNDASIQTAFKTAWFGANVPAGFTMGGYGGSGVGLSTTADAVNIFDSAGTRITGVSFGAATAGKTFDNAAGLGSDTLPLPTISTLSVAGVNGAFLSPTSETGSPGTVPEPTSCALLSLAGIGILARRRRAHSVKEEKGKAICSGSC